MISRVLEYHREGKSTRFLLEYHGRPPKPGQFLTVIAPGEKEIPLGVSDYRDGEVEVYVDSKGLAQWLIESKSVLVDGPFGRPLKLGNTRAISTGELYHDVLYPLREARRMGFDVGLECIDECDANFPSGRREHWDLVIASVPKERIRDLPPGTLVYVRWVKMNCMNGVCGVCQIKGNLACVEGPFLEVERVVD
ncbi:2-polyprenylphenol hydroxylase [Metallosphaera javensis (ex Sakai et al. 2022)]|uniref:2-polyprenylphenol hydroxylase n=1 Tax=Metallosphaera javensis (ex Sakai et al. 2022) TaxID=2775498 RepID=UPI00259111DF|nr:MAG: dihydroorotate dehydrogenase B (NAD(+)), electron transfer subunit [Metallosphaera javensis (ex Sakai et al. 2022)]